MSFRNYRTIGNDVLLILVILQNTRLTFNLLNMCLNCIMETNFLSHIEEISGPNTSQNHNILMAIKSSLLVWKFVGGWVGGGAGRGGGDPPTFSVQNGYNFTLKYLKYTLWIIVEHLCILTLIMTIVYDLCVNYFPSVCLRGTSIALHWIWIKLHSIRNPIAGSLLDHLDIILYHPRSLRTLIMLHQCWEISQFWATICDQAYSMISQLYLVLFYLDHIFNLFLYL